MCCTPVYERQVHPSPPPPCPPVPPRPPFPPTLPPIPLDPAKHTHLIFVRVQFWGVPSEIGMLLARADGKSYRLELVFIPLWIAFA